MKRMLALVLSAIILLCASACGKEETPSDPDTVRVEESFQRVKLTLPVAYFGNTQGMDLEEYAEKNGFKKVVQNENGSVTITMSKLRYENYLETMKETTQKDFVSLAEAKGTPYIKSVEFSEDFDRVTIRVDRQEYEAVEDMTTASLVAFSASSYRLFAGLDSECRVEVLDDATGEEIEVVEFPEQ